MVNVVPHDLIHVDHLGIVVLLIGIANGSLIQSFLLLDQEVVSVEELGEKVKGKLVEELAIVLQVLDFLLQKVDLHLRVVVHLSQIQLALAQNRERNRGPDLFLVYADFLFVVFGVAFRSVLIEQLFQVHGLIVLVFHDQEDFLGLARLTHQFDEVNSLHFLQAFFEDNVSLNRNLVQILVYFFEGLEGLEEDIAGKREQIRVFQGFGVVLSQTVFVDFNFTEIRPGDVGPNQVGGVGEKPDLAVENEVDERGVLGLVVYGFSRRVLSGLEIRGHLCNEMNVQSFEDDHFGNQIVVNMRCEFIGQVERNVFQYIGVGLVGVVLVGLLEVLEIDGDLFQQSLVDAFLLIQFSQKSKPRRNGRLLLVEVVQDGR